LFTMANRSGINSPKKPTGPNLKNSSTNAALFAGAVPAAVLWAGGAAMIMKRQQHRTKNNNQEVKIVGVIYCSECSKLCMDNLHKMCPQCTQKYLDDEITVAEYLRDNKNSTIDKVHMETKVQRHIILKMMHEGRIIEGELSYACEKCGAAVHSGRYCQNCAQDVLTPASPARTEAEENSHGLGGYKILGDARRG
jgi:hypothetical protein